LQNVCEEIPPFPPRESALLGRLKIKHGDKDMTLEREGTRKTTKKPTFAEPNGNGSAAPDTVNDITSSLLGLDMTASPSTSQSLSSFPDLSSQSAAALAEKGIPRLSAGPNIERWFDKLLYSSEGVLYEDVQIQIGIKSRYHGHLGQLAIYMGNKISAPLTSFTATLHVDEPEALSVSFAKIAPSIIAPRTQTQQLLHVECKKPFTKPPILSVSFLAGAHQTIAVRLPIVLTKFLEHVKLGQADFFERWRLIGGPPREAQSIFPIKLDDSGFIDRERHRQVVSGFSLNVLDDIDPNPNNIVAAGILHMSTDGKVGCLMRLEPNREAKLCRITVRSTSEDVAAEVQKLVQKPLNADSLS